MIWGETTSIMGTHDTETENYFKGAQWFSGIQMREMMGNDMCLRLGEPPVLAHTT